MGWNMDLFVASSMVLQTQVAKLWLEIPVQAGAAVRVFRLENQSGESYRPLTPIFLKTIAIHLPFPSRYSLQKYALPLVESSIYTTNLYLDTPILLQKYKG